MHRLRRKPEALQCVFLITMLTDKQTMKTNKNLGLIVIISIIATIAIFFFVLLPILKTSIAWLVMGVILLISLVVSLVGLIALTKNLEPISATDE